MDIPYAQVHTSSRMTTHVQANMLPLFLVSTCRTQIDLPAPLTPHQPGSVELGSPMSEAVDLLRITVLWAVSRETRYFDSSTCSH